MNNETKLKIKSYTCSRCHFEDKYNTKEYNGLVNKLVNNCSEFRKSYENIMKKYQKSDSNSNFNNRKINKHSSYTFAKYNCDKCNVCSNSMYQFLTIYLTYLYYLYFNDDNKKLNDELDIINDIFIIKNVDLVNDILDFNIYIKEFKDFIKKNIRYTSDTIFCIQIIYIHLNIMINDINMEKKEKRYIIFEELSSLSIFNGKQKKNWNGIKFINQITIFNENNIIDTRSINEIKSSHLLFIKNKQNYQNIDNKNYEYNIWKLCDFCHFLQYYKEINNNYKLSDDNIKNIKNIKKINTNNNNDYYYKKENEILKKKYEELKKQIKKMKEDEKLTKQIIGIMFQKETLNKEYSSDNESPKNNNNIPCLKRSFSDELYEGNLKQISCNDDEIFEKNNSINNCEYNCHSKKQRSFDDIRQINSLNNNNYIDNYLNYYYKDNNNLNGEKDINIFHNNLQIPYFKNDNSL